MTSVDIPFTSDVLDVDQYVTGLGKSLVAGALVNGRVGLVDYSLLVGGARPDEAEEDEQPDFEGRLFTRAWTTKPANKSCRGARFTEDGLTIRTISKDRTLAAIDVETGKVSRQWVAAHDTAPSRILSLNGHPHHFVTGDDDGVVKLWDARQADGAGASQVFTQHSDWITDMVWAPNLTLPSRVKRDGPGGKKKVLNASTQGTRDRLVAVAGDGLLSVMDLRFGTSKTQKAQGALKPGIETEDALWRAGVEVSADQEDELLSVRTIRNGKRLVVGTGLGPISIWSPEKGVTDHVDRLAGHPASVDSIDVLDASYGMGDTLLTASSDGMVRIVELYPHKLLGVAADHGGFPVERVTHAGDWMATVGHESFVRLTNLRELLEEVGSDDSDSDEGDEDRPSGGIASVGGSEDDSDSESSSDSDSEGSLDSATMKQLQQEADSSSDGSDSEAGGDAGPAPVQSKDQDWGSDSDSDAPPRKKRKEKKEKKEKKTAFAQQVSSTVTDAAAKRKKEAEKRSFFEDL